MLLLCVGKIVETTDLVRAVVRTEARTNASVVYHDIETLGIMDRRAYGTDDFAWRLLAVHAQDWLKETVRRIRVAFPISIDAQPVHLPLMDHLLLADHRDVVFGLARDDAGIAPDTGVEIDT